MTNEERMRRAEHARALLEDPLIIEAFSRLRENATAGWQHTAVGQREEREAFFYLHCAIEDLYGFFVELLNEGKVAAHAVKREIDAAERKRLLELPEDEDEAA
jgi:hypothetical protein